MRQPTNQPTNQDLPSNPPTILPTIQQGTVRLHSCITHLGAHAPPAKALERSQWLQDLGPCQSSGVDPGHGREWKFKGSKGVVRGFQQRIGPLPSLRVSEGFQNCFGTALCGILSALCGHVSMRPMLEPL